MRRRVGIPAVRLRPDVTPWIPSRWGPSLDASGERRYRLEVEGLRAIAALLVAIYHVFLGRVSGGVDVFFAIAGFLITSSLLAQATSDAGVRAGRYLARLAVRLLPLAVLVLVAVAIATVAWLPETRQGGALQEIAASAVYLENWALAAKAVDYLAQHDAKSPVQHFWAMSVQGQFYVAWLVLFGVVARVGGRDRLRRWIGVALVAIAAGSLAVSVVLTAGDQPFAYFHTGTRMWEFAAGGLLAVALPASGGLADRLGRARRPLAFAAGWLGLGLIVSCGLVLRVSTQFPGWAALWPVAGAVLVVAAGRDGGRWCAGRLLASRPLVYLGGVAYALYLWHWPILVMARVGAGSEGPLDLAPGAAVIGLSVLLAIISTRVVEHPIRLRLGSTRRPWAVTATAGALLLVVASTTFALGAPPAIPVAEAMPDPATHPGAAALGPRRSPSVPGGSPGAGSSPGAGGPSAVPPEDEDEDVDWSSIDDEDTGAAEASIPPAVEPDPARPPVEFVPDLRTARVDLNDMYASVCHIGGRRAALHLCERGDPQGRVTALLAGGSHVTHFYPAVNRLAKQRGWRVVTALKGSCMFFVGDHGTDERDRSCTAWNEQLHAWIQANRPDIVITTGTLTSTGGEQLPKEYLRTWRALEDLGIVVLAIRDTPRAGFNRLECLAVHRRDPEACDIPRRPTLDAVSPLASSRVPANVIPVDLTDYLCTPDACPAVVGGVVVYRDRHHLTATYAVTLTPMLAELVPQDPVAWYRQRASAD